MRSLYCDFCTDSTSYSQVGTERKWSYYPIQKETSHQQVLIFRDRFAKGKEKRKTKEHRMSIQKSNVKYSEKEFIIRKEFG